MEEEPIVEVIPKFEQTAFVSRNNHIPDCTIINLDYPLYGTVVVQCEGRRYDLWVVRRALALARELGGELKDGEHR